MTSMRDRVLRRMKELNLNTSQLAKKMGRYQSTLRGFLTGKSQTFRDITGLASALETTPQWLIVGNNGPSPSSAPVANGFTENKGQQPVDPRLVAAAKSLASVVVARAKQSRKNNNHQETKLIEQRMTSYIMSDFERGLEADIVMLTEIARLLFEGGK